MYKVVIKKIKQNSFLINERSKILIVDDDPIIRQATINLVKSTMKNLSSDYEIIEGSDGKDIIETISSETDNLIKLIITDENMTSVLGSEAIREISLIKNKNKIPVVSITATEDEVGLKNIHDSGVDMVLKKPVSKKLIEEIFSIFDL